MLLLECANRASTWTMRHGAWIAVGTAVVLIMRPEFIEFFRTRRLGRFSSCFQPTVAGWSITLVFEATAASRTGCGLVARPDTAYQSGQRAVSTSPASTVLEPAPPTATQAAVGQATALR